MKEGGLPQSEEYIRHRNSVDCIPSSIVLLVTDREAPPENEGRANHGLPERGRYEQQDHYFSERCCPSAVYRNIDCDTE